MEEEPAFDPDLVSGGDGLASFGSTGGSEGRPPAMNEHTKFDESRQCWIFTNPIDGAQYKWDPVRQFYVADIDETLLQQQQSIYGAGSSNTSDQSNTAPTAANPEKKQKKKQKKKKEKILVGEDGKKYAVSKKNRSIYITGLPKDIRESECYEFFSKVAIIERDAETGDYKVKIYRDPATGEPKGDGLVTFLRPEAVPLAILRLDETEIRPGFPLKLTEAKYELKEGQQPANKAAKSKKVASKRKAFDQSAELGWEERENRHVIIKHMFDAKSDEARLDVNFYDDLKAELAEELENKIGGFESIKIFERSPEGVVAAKFSSQLEAEKCIKLMDGRFFGGQKLQCFFYDGFTDYAVAEPDEDREVRDKEWAKFLGDASEEPVRPPSPKRAKISAGEATPPASPKKDEKDQ
eukprot:TRINITY_DN3967_c0_g1_i2.p1 TRINITY_DN3967_c0_g1~~TRINITY_DN3967_c0_g1_i2.p1  ORF type:complete len:409 (-),score=114.34 TRINITY_DN3967_c0_g1_i2:56-1282(-)